LSWMRLLLPGVSQMGSIGHWISLPHIILRKEMMVPASHASGAARSEAFYFFEDGCTMTFMATYRVVLRQSEEGYSVSCPGLPGCWSQGATEEEALANIRDAIREYVEAVEELARDQDSRFVEVT
jgi:predicted RNase H-like HicB family nuclease